MTGEIDTGPDGGAAGVQRSIVLLLLDRAGHERSIAELRTALLGCDGVDLEAALLDLYREGVLELNGTVARASRATRRLDALNLIGI